MRIFKHAFLSLIRKPTKVIIIFVILFIVYGLVFTGIIIRNSAKSSKIHVRKELGATVELKADQMKALQDGLTPKEIGEKVGLPIKLAKEIAKDVRVKELYLTNMAPAVDNNLKSAINMEGDDSSVTFTVSATAGDDGGSGEAPKEQSFMLSGSNQDTPLEFSNGTYKITQGRLRNESDVEKDTLLISEEFASKNKLSVGDTVDLKSTVNQQIYPFEIIGIYSGSSSYMVDTMQTSLYSIGKLCGAPDAAAVEQAQEDGNAATVSFILKDPMDIDSFIKEHKDQMPNEYISLYANDSEYNSLTRPLDLITTIITILLGVVFIAGAVIMIAIITIYVRDRKFEIGLLLSSGEGKLKILSQFILEILVVSIIAFLAAAGLSKATAEYTASWIVKNQLVEDKTDSMQSSSGMVSFGMSDDSNKAPSLNMSDVANDFNVSINIDLLENLFLISLIMVVVSAGAPLLIILGYKPRESLQN